MIQDEQAAGLPGAGAAEQVRTHGQAVLEGLEPPSPESGSSGGELSTKDSTDALLEHIRDLGWYCRLSIPARGEATEQPECTVVILRPDLRRNHAHRAQARSPSEAVQQAYRQAQAATDTPPARPAT